MRKNRIVVIKKGTFYYSSFGYAKNTRYRTGQPLLLWRRSRVCC